MSAKRSASPQRAEEVKLLDVDQVAELLSVTPKAVYHMRDRGQLPGAVKIGRRLRFDRQTLLTWIRQKAGGEAGEGTGHDR